VALRVDGADRAQFENVRLLGLQDTLFLNSKDGNAPCAASSTSRYVEGDVDFIFGDTIAYFQDCEIKSIGGRAASYALAPDTSRRAKYGFVFNRCRFTATVRKPAASRAPRRTQFYFARQWFHNQRCTPYGWMAVDGYRCRLGDTDVYRAPEGTIRQRTLESVGKAVILNSRIGAHIDRDARGRNGTATAAWRTARRNSARTTTGPTWKASSRGRTRRRQGTGQRRAPRRPRSTSANTTTRTNDGDRMTSAFDTRRNFLRTASLAGLAGCPDAGRARHRHPPRKAAAGAAADPWREAQAIARRLAMPVKFRKADYLVTDFGAEPCKLAPVKAWVSFEDQETLRHAGAGFDGLLPGLRATPSRPATGRRRPRRDPEGRLVLRRPHRAAVERERAPAGRRPRLLQQRPGDYAKYGDIDCGANGKLVVSRWQSNDCLNFSSMIYATRPTTSRSPARTGPPSSTARAACRSKGAPTAGGPGRARTPPSTRWPRTSRPTTCRASWPRTSQSAQPASLAEVAPNLSEEKRLLIQGGRANGAPTTPTCRRCPKPACRSISACSASATTCARR
jgi:hypothetical protein